VNKKSTGIIALFLLSGLSGQASTSIPLGFSQTACWSQFLILPEERPQFIVPLSEVDRSTLLVVAVEPTTGVDQAATRPSLRESDIFILDVDQNPNPGHPDYVLDLDGCSLDFFLQAVARPYLLDIIASMCSRGVLSRQRPCLVLEHDPDRLFRGWTFVSAALIKPCDDIKAGINGIYKALQAVGVSEPVVPKATMAAFRDRLPLFVDSLARKLCLNEEEQNSILKIINEGAILIAPRDSPEMTEFRKDHGFEDDLIAGYYLDGDKRIRVAAQSVAGAISVASHEAGHWYAYNRTGRGAREQFSMLFQVASLFAAIEDRLLTKQETLELVHQLLLGMYGEVAPIVQFYELNRESKTDAATQNFGFGKFIARMTNGISCLDADQPYASRWARHVEACIRTQLGLTSGSGMPQLEHYGFATACALIEVHELSKFGRGEGTYPSAIRDTASPMRLNANDPRLSLYVMLSRLNMLEQMPTLWQEYFTEQKILDALNYLYQTVIAYGAPLP
jgi:hypothetical protein